MVSRAIINGSVTSGKTPVVEYKEQNASTWQTVDEKNMEVKGGKFTATLTGLTGSTTYNYRVSVDGVPGAEQSFTTVAEQELENGSLEDWWYQDNKRWNPWAENGTAFWGTGNEGSTILSSIGNVTSRIDGVSGYGALLESKNAMLKLAAGNLFTGDFDFDDDNDHPMDGRLTFGREFTSFPTSLQLYYHYTPATISIVGSTIEETLSEEMRNMVGQPDTFHIYIALTDKQYEIRNATDYKGQYLFNKNDAGIIAYGEKTGGDPVSNWTQIKIPLEYRAYRRPQYLIIVCSSSKYGDYYLGGVGSKLWLDEMELVYE